MRTLPTLAAALSAVALSGPAGAAAPGRYEIVPADGGFLRLDRDTGAAAFCAPSGDGYACRAATEAERAAGTGAATLEKRLAAIEERLKALESAAPAARADARDPTLDLPTEQQIDRAASFFERAMKRLKQIAEDMQKQEAEPDRQRL